MWTGVSKKREAKIRKAVEKDLKDRLVEELKPVLREQAEAEIRTEAFEQAKKALEKEAEEARPDKREREAFCEFVREVELDAHAQAVVASNEADAAETSLRRSRRYMNPLAYLLLLGAIPAAYEAYAHLGLSLAFGAIVATMALTLLVLVATNSSRHERLTGRFNTKRRVASDYLLVAERAKAYRTVHAERLETKKALDKLTNDLQTDKRKLDENHWPQVESLHNARESVRHRIEDPKYRVLDDFDERLAEAQAEAETGATVPAKQTQ